MYLCPYTLFECVLTCRPYILLHVLFLLPFYGMDMGRESTARLADGLVYIDKNHSKS